jgi:hypothetical protein
LQLILFEVESAPVEKSLTFFKFDNIPSMLLLRRNISLYTQSNKLRRTFMTASSDWLPRKRELQLAMSQNWLTILNSSEPGPTPPPTPPWNIPLQDVEDLQTLTDAASSILAIAQSSARTETITAECKAAFEAMIAKMRFIKSRYFLEPPLVDADLISLGLHPKSTSHTPIPAPTTQAEADIGRPGVHLLELYLRAVSGAKADPNSADYGFRIYWGIMPQGGASAEAATGKKRELTQPAISGEELPHSKFTRRKKELLDFPAEDSGKTVFFCIRFENAKGEPGPWGPIFSTIIP